MCKIGIFILIVIFLVSSVQAGHTEWYHQTDCYDRLYSNIEPCQKQYDELRAEHKKVSPTVYEEPELVYEAPKVEPQEDEAQPEEAKEKPVATVINLDGEVWVVKKDGSRKRVSADTVVYSDDTIESKGGRAMLMLQDGHKIVVNRNSQFMFEEQGTAKLNFGSIKTLFSLNKRFRIRTPIANIAIRGTEFILNHDQTTGTTLHLHEGEVEVAIGDETKIVQAGNSIVVNDSITSTALSAEKWNTLAQEFEAEEKTSNVIWIIFVLLAIIIFLIRKRMKNVNNKK